MRSVSLDAKDLEPLLKEKLSDEEIKTFRKEQEKHEEMWKDQGEIFWIKFIITVKEILDYASNDFHSTDDNYISFLMCLVNGDKYNLTVPYIRFITACCLMEETNYEKIVARMNYAKCVAAYVRLYNVWEKSNEGNLYSWNIPKYWDKNSGYSIVNFENYILYLLKNRDIETIFNCKRECIGWLKPDPSPAIATNNPDPSPNTPEPNSLDKTEELRDETQENEVATTLDEKPPACTKTSLDWLPKEHESPLVLSEHHEMELSPLLRETLEIPARVFNLMAVSLPPLLARKYHIVNVAELMKDSKDGHCMGVAARFVMWNQALGLSYLNTAYLKLQQLNSLDVKHKALVKLNKNTGICDEEIKMWMSDVDDIVQCMRQASKTETAPKLQDNPKEASEFLLEPCVIAQLPWNNVLFHQWLAAALVEVLVFEKSSLELRHWPLPPELEPTARELLTVVKQLKERVVLGFAMMSQQVMSHPKVEESHPGWIMDEVVLPSLATLQFLINREAYNILSSIKEIAWGTTGSVIGRIYIPESAYTMESNLNDIYMNLCYNFSSWEEVKKSPPFPLKKCKEPNLKQIIQKLKKNNIKSKSNPENNNSIIKPFSGEETLVFKSKELEKCKQVSSNERIPLLLQTIKESIIDKGRFPDLKWNTVKQIFETDEMQQFAAGMYNIMNTRTPHVAIGCTLMYKDRNKESEGCQPENSIMEKIIKLGIEIMEQESIIRLTNALSVVFKMSPVINNEANTPLLTVKSSNKILEKVRSKSKSQNRDWLWTQFPAKWRKPVTFQEPSLDLNMGTEAIVEICENRIGRILYHLARSSFLIHKRHGEIFPQWQKIQYILPCYVAAFVQYNNESNINSNIKGIQNLLQLIKALLYFYENNYTVWANEVDGLRSKPPSQPQVEIAEISEMYAAILYNKNQINFYSCCFIDPSNNEEFFWAKQLNEALLDWPGKLVKQNQSHVLKDQLTIWLYNILYFFDKLLDLCFGYWNIYLPSPKKELKQVADYFLSFRIIHGLEAMFSMYVAHLPIEQRENPNLNCIRDIYTYGRLDQEVVDLKLVQAYLILKNNCKQAKGSMLETINITENDEIRLVYLYILLKKFRVITTQVMYLKFSQYIPTFPSKMKNTLMYYALCDFQNLEMLLPVVTIPKILQALEYEAEKLFSTQQASSSSGVATNSKSSEGKSKKESLQKCRNCPKTEKKVNSFLVCEKCVEDHYPDVNFFCSKKCQEKWWGAEHMAEHLEFELGLADFSHLSVE